MRARTGIVAGLVAAMVFTGAGCTTGGQDPDDPADRTTTSAAPSPTTTETTATPAPPTATTAGPTTSAAAAGCAVTMGWTTGADEEKPYSTDKLFRVRAGRHDCFDRVVFDIQGVAPAGFLVQYVSQVAADGSGDPVPVAGGAALQVIVRASVKGYPSGEPPARVGDRLYTTAQLTGWKALREVRYAGFFEGQSTIAVGVRAKLPFRAYTVLDTTTKVRKVVVDIAHR